MNEEENLPPPEPTLLERLQKKLTEALLHYGYIVTYENPYAEPEEPEDSRIEMIMNNGAKTFEINAEATVIKITELEDENERQYWISENGVKKIVKHHIPYSKMTAENIRQSVKEIPEDEKINLFKTLLDAQPDLSATTDDFKANSSNKNLPTDVKVSWASELPQLPFTLPFPNA